ncbi:MAG: NADH-quinone oxidoreductase subunit A [Acidobacteriota bacterium]
MPQTYPELYFPILVQVLIAAGLAAALVFGTALLGKRAKSPLKDTPYESGMAPVGSARERFSVKFFLVGMIFILFDIEAIFLYPWAVVYRDLKMFGFFEMLVFVVLVLVGFFYVYKKGALDWSLEKPESPAQRLSEARRQAAIKAELKAGIQGLGK